MAKPFGIRHAHDRYHGDPQTGLSAADRLLDDGVKLATIPRGPNRELRIRWREFKAHHFVDLRQWSVNPWNRQWWPDKGKGITVKARELEQVLDALKEAREFAASRAAAS
jgi:hypothetical protein